MTNLTTTGSRRTSVVRLINQFGEILNRLHLRPVDLSCEQTGLSDWGEEDFLTPLTVLLDAYEKEADLSLLGRLIVQKNMIRLLTNRLRIQRDLTRHPEILQQSVNKPLFIVGLPRTGTTLLFNLDALLAVFPDACIIHTHRDLVKAIGSSCSLMAMVRQMSSHNAEPAAIGSLVLNELAIGVDRAMEVRKCADAERFYDLAYRDLMADPKGQVKKIYDYFGYPFDEGMAAGMEQWLRENRQHKHGVHHYSLAQFGLSEQQIRARFAEYIDQYAIEAEG